MGESEEWEIDLQPSFIAYKLNDKEEKFEKLPHSIAEEIHPYLLSENIVLIIDMENQNAYIWEGSAASIHMKFLAARIAPTVRDRHGTMNLHSIDQSSEPDGFKVFMKLP
ncbi:MAG: hypothetical protein JW776_13295 [Candidatus Lokiarchaeota archaeon]|nr:hypothetical protein [Candidatus Lokiarchaeota archaeon]